MLLYYIFSYSKSIKTIDLNKTKLIKYARVLICLFLLMLIIVEVFFNDKINLSYDALYLSTIVWNINCS